MLSRNGILKFFFLLSLTSHDFWSLFCPSPLFRCLWISFLDCTHFVTIKCWAVNLLLHCFHPILHLIFSLICNPTFQCAVDLALHMARALGRTLTSTSASSLHVQSSCKSLSREKDLENPFLPAGMSYRGTQVRHEGQTIYNLDTVWHCSVALFLREKEKETKNPSQNSQAFISFCLRAASLFSWKISEVFDAKLPFRWKFGGALQEMCRNYC